MDGGEKVALGGMVVFALFVMFLCGLYSYENKLKHDVAIETMKTLQKGFEHRIITRKEFMEEVDRIKDRNGI